MKTTIFALISLSFLLSCTQVKTENAARLNQADCPEIQGLDYLLSDAAPEIIVIGESHGMVQPPELVKALTCHSEKRGYRTALALEISDEKNLYKDYLESDGTESDKSALFEDWMWKGLFTDGRSSDAMLGLIDYARVRSQVNSDFSVIFFKPSGKGIDKNLNRSQRSQIYEKQMAQNILDGADQSGAQKTFVLVGNLHARRGRYSYNDLEYDLMALHLPKNKAITLDAVYSAGTSWNCRGPEPKDCGEHTVGGSVAADSDLAKSGKLTIILSSDKERIAPFIGRLFKTEWYDGVVYIGEAKASPPANLENRTAYSADND